MKLNLGCCDHRPAGDWLNVDIVPPADWIADLTQGWPWADSSVQEILARDVIEHLPDKRHTMNEMWRVLVPGGIARIQVPDVSEGDGGHCDPTHVSYWTRSDFEYYHPEFAERERFRPSTYYAIKADFRVVGQLKRTRYERRLGGFVMEIEAVLAAVK